MTRLAALACLLLLTPGCQQAGGPGPARAAGSPYYPLEVGSRWLYGGPDGVREIRVVRHEWVGEVPCALVRSFEAGGPGQDLRVYADDRGIFALVPVGQGSYKPLPVLRLPPTPGRTWTVTEKKDGRVTRHVYVVGAETVEVPFGKFDAVTVREDVYTEGDRSKAAIQYFARDVGMVKQVVKIGDQVLTYELTDFARGEGNK